MSILQSSQVRTWALNVPLILLFIAAWLSDRYPELSAPALVAVAAIFVVEIVVLYAVGERRRKESSTIVESVVMPAAEPAPVTEPAGRGYNHLELLVIQELEQAAPTRQIKQHLYAKHRRRWQASRSSTWAVAQAMRGTSSEIKAIRPFGAPIAQIGDDIPEEIKEWRLVKHGPSAFKIEAGVLEIEFFHGNTHVNVLDPARVTIGGGVVVPQEILVTPLVKRLAN